VSLNVIRKILDSPGCAKGSAWEMLIAMANRASDEGAGIWESIPNLGRISGMGAAAAYRAKDSLAKAGLIVWTGEWHHNGRGQPTKVYRLDMNRIVPLRTRASQNESLSEREVSAYQNDRSVPITTIDEPVLKPVHKPVHEEREGGSAAGLSILQAEIVNEPAAPAALPQPDAGGSAERPFPVRAAAHLWQTCLSYPRFRKLLPAWEKEMEALGLEIGEDKLKGVLRYVRQDVWWRDRLMESPNPMLALAKWLRTDKDGGLLDKYERSKAVEAAPPPQKKEEGNARRTGNTAIDKKFALIEHNRAVAAAAIRFIDSQGAGKVADNALPA
jgi:hypothetical protein